ncbi:RING finger protein nhl-1-like isoform X2 [Anopheles albimanus]|uniref:RING finger protein nhl-1-like isoform X2 n=1 Tax=Anopheles albimanus TaxID=7167 RepID=UPI00163FF86C|nr:RING finger protein nhl-1-like isoform X2 [Anopheles albimanus]
MHRGNRTSRLISYDDTTMRSTPMAIPSRGTPVDGSSARRNSLEGMHRELSKTMEHLVICGLCELRLQTPKMLNCQHTFCQECLETRLQMQADKTYISCTTCEAKQLLKDPDLASLPSNLHIDNMLQMMVQRPTATGAAPPPPLKSPVESYQLEKFVPTTTLQCSKCQTVAETQMDKCEHCMSLLCAICWLAHVDELSRQVGQLEGQLKTAVEKLDHKMIEYKNRFNEINDQIQQCIRHKIANLEQQQTQLLDASQGILNDAICSHELVREKIHQLQTSIGRPIQGALDPVQLYLKLHKDLSIILEEVSLWGRERVLFNSEKLKVETIFDNHSSPCIKRSTGGAHPAQTHQLHPDSSETTLVHFYKHHVYKPRLVWNHCQRPSGVAFAPWNHTLTDKPLLYVSGSECRTIFGINKANGQIVQKLSHEELSYPQGLAFDGARKELYVTDKWKHCIFVFSHDGQLLRKIGSKGDQPGQLRSPEGLAVTMTGCIYVCDTGNDRIQSLSTTDGHPMAQFGRLTKDQLTKGAQLKVSSRMVDLKNPTDIAIQKDSTIVVLDAGNRRVKVFSKHGEQLLEFGQMGTINGQFQYPEVIAVDPAGFILVGDGGNAKILVYRPNGQFVTSLGSRGDSAGKFNWISGICVSSDWEIVTSDYKNHAVQMIY